MTAFVKVRSWHVEASQTRTLCGLTVRAHPDRQAGEHQAAGWATDLPPGKTCENCLRALVRRKPDEPIGEGQE